MALTSSPKSHQQQPKLEMNTSNILDIGATYMRKMAGVDFLVKLIGYLVRFKILYLSTSAPNSPQLKNYQQFLGAIVESRMLSNSAKSPSTFLGATKLAETKEDFVNKLNNTSVPDGSCIPWLPSFSSLKDASLVKLVSYFALLFRTFEQVSSDAGYLARYVFLSWDKERLTLEYKRWKSISLSCLLFVELSFLYRYIRQKLDARSQKQQQQQVVSGESSPGSLASPNVPFPSSLSSPTTSNNNADSLHLRSPSTAAFEKAKGLDATHQVALPVTQKYKYRFQHLASGTSISDSDAINSLIVAIRSVCDMYIYYRWLPNWNPPEFWQYWAGIVSALLGIHLVMEETVGEVRKKQQTVDSSLLAKAVDDRKNKN